VSINITLPPNDTMPGAAVLTPAAGRAALPVLLVMRSPP
jgi:hypothetical protein